jgi:hypothetical protein
VFADWLDEHDDPRGPGYRALGLLRRTPALFNGSPSRWVWLNARWAASYHDRVDRGAALLPDDWYDHIPPAGTVADPCAEERTVLRESLDDAAVAFVKLSAQRQAELLAAPPPEDLPVPKKSKPRKKPAVRKPKGKGKK